ncbi:hypothetical protein P4561_20830, partial [Priestia flexa]|uniref:hypothetical protein n=1 Tax=Priestia flexa TaxID=86664 RepID=UPI002E215712|nr:hypothetical protein [Priestia flexa]
MREGGVCGCMGISIGFRTQTLNFEEETMMFGLKTGKRYNKCIRKLNKISMTNGMFERGKKKMAYQAC